LGLPAGASVLDIGCGGGWFFPQLRDFGWQVEGIESDPRLVPTETGLRDTIHVDPFNRSFQPGKQYALILMLDVLEHMPDACSSLRYAVELLQPEGRLLLTVPTFLWLWTAHDDLNHHVTRYTKRSLARLAESAGMRMEICRYFFQWLVPMKLAVRVKERLLPTHPASPRVPPRLINQFCYGVSRLEQTVCAALPIPFGSSLLALGGRR